jgi:hypothetical protein
VGTRHAIADHPPCTTDHAPLARLSRTILRKALLQASVEFGESHELENATRDAADAYARMAKADNTRRAYRAAVRAWCAWCLKRDRPPLPAAGCAVPTDDVCVSETLAGLDRLAKQDGQGPKPKLAAPSAPAARIVPCPVGKKVGNVRNDSPGLIEPIPELETTLI